MGSASKSSYSNKFKVGDTVTVIAGRDKGKQGKILKKLANGRRFIVEGIHMLVKHTKPSQGQPGSRKSIEGPIDISNVAIINGGKADRVGFKFLEDGKKVRIYKSTGEVIDS